MIATMPTAAELLPLLPQLVLAGGAFALLMLDLFLDDARRVVTWLLGGVLLLVVAWMSFAGVGGQGTVLAGMFVRDTMADVLNGGACLMVAVALVYAWPFLRERNLHKGEVGNANVATMRDIDMREWIVLGTFAAGVLLLGVWPKPLTDLMEPSIAQLAGQLAASKL